MTRNLFDAVDAPVQMVNGNMFYAAEAAGRLDQRITAAKAPSTEFFSLFVFEMLTKCV